MISVIRLLSNACCVTALWRRNKELISRATHKLFIATRVLYHNYFRLEIHFVSLLPKGDFLTKISQVGLLVGEAKHRQAGKHQMEYSKEVGVVAFQITSLGLVRIFLRSELIQFSLVRVLQSACKNFLYR